MIQASRSPHLQGARRDSSDATTSWRALCIAPAVAFFAAFWLLPMVRLLVLPADKGWATYLAVLTESNYLASLLNTLVLSLGVTLMTLVLGASVGIFMARSPFMAAAKEANCARVPS